MEWIIGRRLIYCAYLMLVWVFVIEAAGCSSLRGVAAPREEPVVNEAELMTWDEGLQAFENGDYQKAAAVFDLLSETAETNGLSRKAFFALACTKFILAQSPEEFKAALGIWDCWSRQLPEGLEGGEDPRMMTPFLERLAPPGVPETPVAQEKPVVKKVIVYSHPTGCKDLLQAKDKEIERMRSKVEAREREVKRLKHQIESLEAIHLKYQERKQGVSVP